MTEQTARSPIVVGVDDSEAARRALAWAIDEAMIRHTSVHAVSVWAVDPATDFVWTPSEQMHKIAEEKLANAVRRVVEGRENLPTIVQRTVEGAPATALVEAAEGAAMLVVATHRGERLRKALLGSVSAECVRYSNVPVVVVRPEPGGA